MSDLESYQDSHKAKEGIGSMIYFYQYNLPSPQFQGRKYIFPTTCSSNYFIVYIVHTYSNLFTILATLLIFYKKNLHYFKVYFNDYNLPFLFRNEMSMKYSGLRSLRAQKKIKLLSQRNQRIRAFMHRFICILCYQNLNLARSENLQYK